MSTTQTEDRPDIWSMAVVHQYYRREFDLAPRVIRDLAPHEDERQRQAAAWFATTLAMMHHHHVTEDALMYPLLQGRAPQVLLDRMESQHERVADAVDAAEAALVDWRPADPESGETLAATFDAMLPELVRHLDAEEQEIMPLVAELLTVEEYARQGTSGNAFSDRRALMMAFGAMVEQASPYETEVMLSHPPEAVRQAWRDHGRREYTELMTLLRAGLPVIGPRANPATGPALS